MIKECNQGSSEGDVETQVVLPLLCNDAYLGIPRENVKSKEYLAPRDIDKGRSKKAGYVPDFGVYTSSLPVLVVEAKSPANSTEDAYAEACLYAHEINRAYRSAINPCAIVIGTNGVTLRAGYWDSDPSIDCNVADLIPGNAVIDSLTELVSFHALNQHAEKISAQIRIRDYKRPFNQGEGAALINSQIGENTFAADLSPILRRYFTSHDQQGEAEIYEQAYIPSAELQSHDRNLAAYLKDRITRSKSSGRVDLKPTKRSEPKLGKVVKSHSDNKSITGSLQLITGAVGAGKSLFARRYKEYLQPAELAPLNHWSFINFNDAPPKLSDAKEWVCETFAKSLIAEGAPVDLVDPSDQERVFAPKLLERKAYYDRMNTADPRRGDLERARDIEQWRQDPVVLSECLARYLQGDRSENLIVVFDNVDRRDTEDQLECFQLALWFMAQSRALLLLQMRDVTFELFKNEPPLDTYRSGTVFHITPPRFIDVVRRRLELSLDYLANEAPELVTYTLPSGAKIKYPKSRAGEFLHSIYVEIFQKPRNIATVIEALSGRDVRRALDMFMSIITSGHMPEDIITSVAQGSRDVGLSEYRLIRILMRGAYKFHHLNSGFISNIFYCDANWKRPSNFIVPEILFWLIGNRKLAGDNGHMGYFSARHVCDELEAIGFVREDVHSACKYALTRGLIEADTLSLVNLEHDDCIKATASGWAHLRILCERLEYLHAVLPTTPIYDNKLRQVVFDRMKIENQFRKLHLHQVVSLVQGFQKYLRAQKSTLDNHHEYAQRKTSGANYVLGKVQSCLESYSKGTRNTGAQPDLLDR